MPTTRPLSVTTHLHTPTGTRLPATWAYDPADPLAVTLHIHPHRCHPVTWVLARDLLDTGLHTGEPVGHGDVRLWSPPPRHPTPGALHIELRSDTGHAHLTTDWDTAAAFTRRTHTTMPAGGETGLVTGCLDQLLTQLLQGKPGDRPHRAHGDGPAPREAAYRDGQYARRCRQARPQAWDAFRATDSCTTWDSARIAGAFPIAPLLRPARRGGSSWAVRLWRSTRGDRGCHSLGPACTIC
ncbi:MAG: SsgA family sporulation/cell division regulator [Pseudonocardiaceae bacterium]